MPPKKLTYSAFVQKCAKVAPGPYFLERTSIAWKTYKQQVGGAGPTDKALSVKDVENSLHVWLPTVKDYVTSMRKNISTKENIPTSILEQHQKVYHFASDHIDDVRALNELIRDYLKAIERNEKRIAILRTELNRKQTGGGRQRGGADSVLPDTSVFPVFHVSEHINEKTKEELARWIVKIDQILHVKIPLMNNAIEAATKLKEQQKTALEVGLEAETRSSGDRKLFLRESIPEILNIVEDTLGKI